MISETQSVLVLLLPVYHNQFQCASVNRQLLAHCEDTVLPYLGGCTSSEDASTSKGSRERDKTTRIVYRTKNTDKIRMQQY